MTDCPLSSELKVACEIYRFNKAGEPVHFGKLVDSLKGVMNKQVVSAALDTLEDWMITCGHYGSLGDGRAGYLIEIDRDEEKKIGELYEKYWKVREG
jgi:hypothetical protein